MTNNHLKKGLVLSDPALAGKSKGFTLIELLVVLSIITLLVALVTVNTQSSRSKSRDARRISDLKTIQAALELYFADKKQYPTLIYSNADFLTYINPVPIDIKQGNHYCYYLKSGTTWLTNDTTCTVPAGINPNVLNYWLRANLEKPNREADLDLTPLDNQSYDIGG